MCQSLAEKHLSSGLQKSKGAPVCMHLGKWVHFGPTRLPTQWYPLRAPGVYNHAQLNHFMALAFIMHQNIY